MKATDTISPTYEEARAEMKASRAQQRIQSFHERWAPKESGEAYEFHAEFDMLIMDIYREAGEPYVKQMGKIVEAMSYSSILSPKPVIMPDPTKAP